MRNFFARVNQAIQAGQREPNHPNFVSCATCLPSWMRPVPITCRPSGCATADIRIAGLARPTSAPAGSTTFTATAVHSCPYLKYAAEQCFSPTSLHPDATVHDRDAVAIRVNTRPRSAGYLCASICQRSPRCPPLRRTKRRSTTLRAPSLDLPNSRSRNAIQAAIQSLYAHHYLVNLIPYVVFYLNVLRSS